MSKSELANIGHEYEWKGVWSRVSQFIHSIVNKNFKQQNHNERIKWREWCIILIYTAWIVCLFFIAFYVIFFYVTTENWNKR